MSAGTYPYVQRVPPVPAPTRRGLTARELEVLALIVEGKCTREIGLELSISPETVRVYVRRVLAKLGVHTRTAAAVTAVQAGLVEGAR